MFLDSSSCDVMDQLNFLMDCCSPTPGSVKAKRPSPPWVRIEWGRAALATFNAYVTQAGGQLTKFDNDGTPTHAIVSVTLEEIGEQ
ncbi:hypothetical protein E2651_10075 [Streptomyces sp. MZ04]|nr:hypothetical protein E2651_10075 [Streptomyces sp. MZ04]